MEHKTRIEEVQAERDGVITLGKFDGVHRGHRKLLARVHEIARQQSLQAVVFTFSIAPQIHLGERPAQMLMTNRERAAFLREQNIDLLVECAFTEQIRNMEAETFIRDVLVGRLRAKALVVGTDFRFGKERAGTPEFLCACADKYGFTVDVIEKEKDNETGRDISSTYTREELARGNMEKVTDLLGYPYFVTGEIVHGRHLGHSLGFPTINQIPDPGKMLPPYGVYFSRTTVAGKIYQGISNIGVKPTVEGKDVGIETYLFDCSFDLYGQEARVELLHFRRPEQHFDSLEDLQRQIDADINAADRFFSS